MNISTESYDVCRVHQAEERCPTVVKHITQLIKKLLIIVSRPARLLECLVSSHTHAQTFHKRKNQDNGDTRVVTQVQLMEV